MPEPKTLFISHSRRDKGFVQELCALIKTAAPDLEFFCSSEENTGLAGGESVTDGHHKAIRGAIGSVLVITPASRDSVWCVQEWGICQYVHGHQDAADKRCFQLIAPGMNHHPGFLGRDLAKEIERPELNGLVDWVKGESEEPCTNSASISSAIDRVLEARQHIGTSEVQSLIAKVEEVVEFLPALKALQVDQSGLSEQLQDLREALDSRDRAVDLSNTFRRIIALNSRNPIVLAGAGVSQELANRLTPVTEKVLGLEDSNRDVETEFRDDYSTVYGLLQQLAAGLPVNSVWLGVSRLTSDDAWDPGPLQLKMFQASLEEKTKLGALRVRRLYVAREEQELGTTMIKHIERAVAAKVDVRVLRLKEDEIEPADISLLWIPPESLLRIPPEGEQVPNLDGELSDLGFSLAAALEFTVRSREALDGVKIYSGQSQRLAQLSSEFNENWARSEPWEAAK